MEMVGQRRGQLVEMTAHNDYAYLVFSIPGPRADRPAHAAARTPRRARPSSIIASKATGRWSRRFPAGATGVLVSIAAGRAVAYGLDSLASSGPKCTSAPATWSTRA